MCRGFIRNDTNEAIWVRVYTHRDVANMGTLVDSRGMPHHATYCWFATDKGYGWSVAQVLPNTSYAFALKYKVPKYAKYAQVLDMYFSDDFPSWRQDHIERVRFRNIKIIPPPPAPWWSR
jgi:hypothetical protein